MRSPASKRTIAIVVCTSALAATPSSADLATCLNETGYALSEINSAVVVQGEIHRATTLATCDPPQAIDLGILGLDGGSALTSYLIGFGAIVTTGSIATPNSSQASSARVSIQQYFKFTVIPDAPGSTDPVPITVVARHRFGTVAQDSSGSGSAAVTHVGRYELRQGIYNGVQIGAPWNTEAFPASDGSFFDIIEEIDVPPTVPIFLWANLQQECWSHGGGGATSGSASCSVESEVTYHVSTDAPAAIVFEAEQSLGMDPPQLEVLPVPEPDAGALPSVALGVLLALRTKTRRRIG